MLESLLSRYSSCDSIRKAMAWLVCFKKYLVGPVNKDPDGTPSKPDCHQGYRCRECHHHSVRHDMFSAELAVVGQRKLGNEKKLVSQSSPIRNLNPFLGRE